MSRLLDLQIKHTMGTLKFPCVIMLNAEVHVIIMATLISELPLVG